MATRTPPATNGSANGDKKASSSVEKTAPSKPQKGPALNVRAKTAPVELDPQWIAHIVRRNIRLLKGLRNLTDEEITRRGRYTSRQVYHNRLNGDVDFSTEDFARISAALDVEPHVLFMDEVELIQWAVAHPEYKGPSYPPQEGRGAKTKTKKSAPQNRRSATKRGGK